MSNSEKSAGLAVVSDQRDAPATAVEAELAALTAVMHEIAIMAGCCMDALQAALDHDDTSIARSCLHTLAAIGMLCDMAACHQGEIPYNGPTAPDWLAGPSLRDTLRAAGWPT